MSSGVEAFWSLAPKDVLDRLGGTPEGLSQEEAARRLEAHGPNELREQQRVTTWTVLSTQLRNPLLLLLVFAATASLGTGEWVDAVIVVTIVLASVGVGFSREYRAQRAVDELRARVRTHATVLRSGHQVSVPLRE